MPTKLPKNNNPSNKIVTFFILRAMLKVSIRSAKVFLRLLTSHETQALLGQLEPFNHFFDEGATLTFPEL